MKQSRYRLLRFNSLQTGKRIPSTVTHDLRIGRVVVSIPFKRESVFQERRSSLTSMSRSSNGFNSLQTGKRIPST